MTERRVSHLIEGLSAQRPGKRESNLDAIARLWLPLSSSFSGAGASALPAFDQVDAIATFVAAVQPAGVQVAALHAMCAAWRVLKATSERNGQAFQLEQSEACVAALERGIQAESHTVRIAASRLLAAFPCSLARASLQRSLADPIWTVRWNAVAALAVVEPNDELVKVLEASRPKSDTAYDLEDYVQAWAALGRAGLARESNVR